MTKEIDRDTPDRDVVVSCDEEAALDVSQIHLLLLQHGLARGGLQRLAKGLKSQQNGEIVLSIWLHSAWVRAWRPLLLLPSEECRPTEGVAVRCEERQVCPHTIISPVPEAFQGG